MLKLKPTCACTHTPPAPPPSRPCREVPARGVAGGDAHAEGARHRLRAEPGGGLDDGEDHTQDMGPLRHHQGQVCAGNPPPWPTARRPPACRGRCLPSSSSSRHSCLHAPVQGGHQLRGSVLRTGSTNQPLAPLPGSCCPHAGTDSS